MNSPTLDQLTAALKRKGYPVFEKGDLNVNLVAIRSATLVADRFDDLVCVFYKKAGQWVMMQWKATADPGLYYLKRPMQPKGCAILVPGHYPGSHMLGLHFGKPALQQKGNLRIYRDANCDNILDMDAASIVGSTYADGINVHYSQPNATVVSNWSAGCIVLAHGPNDKPYTDFIDTFRQAIKAGWPNSFSLTLITDSDLYA